MKTVYITTEQRAYLNAKPKARVVLKDGASIYINASGNVTEVIGTTDFIVGENVNMEVK